MDGRALGFPEVGRPVAVL